MTVADWLNQLENLLQAQGKWFYTRVCLSTGENVLTNSGYDDFYRLELPQHHLYYIYSTRVIKGAHWILPF